MLRHALTTDLLIAGLTAIVGDKYVLHHADDKAPFEAEWRGLYKGTALLVVKPGSVQEVADVLKFAQEHRLKIIPQGGNTGLVGGNTPDETGTEIVLSLARLNRIREVDALSDTMTVEAGVTLLRAQEAATEADRLFPLSLASEGTCTIGGNLGTNAGGTAVLAYGNARDLVLGLEVVLADGRILNGLGKLRKDNTGYDLKHLFIGSEGTLGIITAAVLKLFPKPNSLVTVFCGLVSPKHALDLLELAKRSAGQAVTTFELLPRLAIDMVVDHMAGCRDPLATRCDWYVLMELSSASDPYLEDRAQSLLEEALDKQIILDAAMANSLDQRNDFWRLRETLPEAQAFKGGSIKHDVSVPVSCVPELIALVDAEVIAAMPGIRPMPFGHLGDGNLHYNLTQPVGMDKQAYMDQREVMHAIVYKHVLAMGGSVSAEHGIGRLKKHLLQQVKDPVALELMHSLKQMLDPHNILNPGRVL
ncbi:MAG: FAD-binding oxidoreductase [Beijerinckiaceae bacterium]